MQEGTCIWKYFAQQIFNCYIYAATAKYSISVPLYCTVWVFILQCKVQVSYEAYIDYLVFVYKYTVESL